MGRESPELIKRRACNMESYGFEDLLSAQWYLFAVLHCIPSLVSYNNIFVLKMSVVYGSVGLQPQQGNMSTWVSLLP
jgi:TRAP-type mannitol/chloroaromatic compound transport system permease small subunit